MKNTTARSPRPATPALTAWQKRGIPGEQLPDTLWSCAAWEQSALEAVELGDTPVPDLLRAFATAAAAVGAPVPRRFDPDGYRAALGLLVQRLVAAAAA